MSAVSMEIAADLNKSVEHLMAQSFISPPTKGHGPKTEVADLDPFCQGNDNPRLPPVRARTPTGLLSTVIHSCHFIKSERVSRVF